MNGCFRAPHLMTWKAALRPKPKATPQHKIKYAMAAGEVVHRGRIGCSAALRRLPRWRAQQPRQQALGPENKKPSVEALLCENAGPLNVKLQRICPSLRLRFKAWRQGCAGTELPGRERRAS